MNRTAGFHARQRVWLTLVNALLFLVIGVGASSHAASSNHQLPEVGPAMLAPQGILIVYSERYVIEDDGVLVFQRRPVQVYTDTGQLVGSYAPIGDAPVRLDIPPGNYIVAFQRQGILQKVRASVKDAEETVVTESFPEPSAPRAPISPW